jgi:hypothetical protein
MLAKAESPMLSLEKLNCPNRKERTRTSEAKDVVNTAIHGVPEKTS